MVLDAKVVQAIIDLYLAGDHSFLAAVLGLKGDKFCPYCQAKKDDRQVVFDIHSVAEGGHETLR